MREGLENPVTMKRVCTLPTNTPGKFDRCYLIVDAFFKNVVDIRKSED